MYYVYKTIKGRLVQQATFTEESLAKQKALVLKGLVMRDGKIWFDFR